MLRLLGAILFLSVNGCLALNNGLARTPPMGWMSWTLFLCETDCVHHPFTCIHENLYKEQADRLASDGYKAVGYDIIHIDDCWMEHQRDGSGKLIADHLRFPSGIPALAQYLHNLGLKLGIYEDYGTKTCGGYPGSYGFLEIDANTFAEWKVDYLKLDGCNIDPDKYPIGYPAMEHYLNVSGRPIAYSCSWPAYLIDQPEKVNYTQIGQSCNLWRNFDDISLSWPSILSIIDYYSHNQDKLIPANGPGRWNDPDMIIVGNPAITPAQSRVQMSLWSIWSAPLIMSNDLRLIAPIYKEILLNERVIAVDQDPLGMMGRLVANTSAVGVYVKQMTPVDVPANSYSYAVAVFNRSNKAQNVSFTLEKLGIRDRRGYFVQDLWTGHQAGRIMITADYTIIVEPTGVHLFKATLAF